MAESYEHLMGSPIPSHLGPSDRYAADETGRRGTEGPYMEWGSDDTIDTPPAPEGGQAYKDYSEKYKVPENWRDAAPSKKYPGGLQWKRDPNNPSSSSPNKGKYGPGQGGSALTS